MKRLITLMTSLLSLSAFAGVPSELYSISCEKDINAVLKKNGSKDVWTRTVDPQRGVMAFNTPTTEFAKWIEIHSSENPYVFIYEPESIKVFQFDKKNCSLLVNITSEPFDFLKKKKAKFSDEKLKSLVDAERPSMVYIWSPSMVYSMSEMAVFMKTAKELEMDFVPVLTFNEDEEEAKKLVSGHQPDLKFEKFKSLELYMREGTVHFPSTYIVGNGHISERIFGVLTPDLLRERALEQLANIKRGR